MRCPLLGPLLLVALIACRSAGTSAGGGGGAGRTGEAAETVAAVRPDWVLVIHGGSGHIDPAIEVAYRAGLEAALRRGSELLAAGGTSLDAVEAVVTMLEDDPTFNAGRGAVFTHAGTHELDASIRDGASGGAGAVAAVTTVRHPIRLARLVMERTPHVLLVGPGADAFAGTVGVERVANDWFDTPRRRQQLDDALAAERGAGGGSIPRPPLMGTVGAVALDHAGHLAAATSTGGTTAKLPGRVGDTAIVGAGTWAADATCAVSATGKGEQFIRHAAAARVAMLVAERGLSLSAAADEVISRVLAPGDGGLIAVARDGSVATPFSAEMMGRGIADSGGRFEVRVGRDEP
jgi:beta-aspartyl-peptidase (threonine type)